MSLDGYDVLRELGRGGMAVVHLARQRDLDRLVALKELAGLNAGDPAFAERFLRESRVAGSLNHQSIVTVYDYFDDSGTPFIAMELVEGGSLRPLIGELSLPRVGRVLEDLLAAVGHAGRLGIVHRDLKPENALITADGHVKVADFGIAKAAQSGQQGLTTEGMTVGTPEYMSPEQAMARDVGPASDLYALGCMTYEMLTGRLPFTDSAQAAILMHQVNDPVPDVRDTDPLIPESIAQWVARMTAKDPEERPADAGEAWDTFEDALVEFSGPLWRRDADLEPGSKIDLDDLPPMGPTPIRPKAKNPQSPTGSVTGFATYHAPAALHEQFGDEQDRGDGGATVATPPPVRAPRRVTPAPQTASPAAGVVRTNRSTSATPAVAQQRRSPVGAIAGGALLVAAAAFGIGIATGGSSSSLASATGPGLELRAPEGWTAVKGDATTGLGAGAVALAPSGAAGGQGIAAGRMSRDAALGLARGKDLERVKLGAGESARYGDSLFLLFTDDGTVVVRCGEGAPVRAACGGAAAGLKVTRGEVLPLGPTSEGGQAVNGALRKLRSGISNPRSDLGDATSAGAQATAAGDLSRVYRSASSSVGKAEVGVLAESARDRLARALGGVGSGWSSFARAARSGDAGGVASARSSIAAARSKLSSAERAMKASGYPTGSGS